MLNLLSYKSQLAHLELSVFRRYCEGEMRIPISNKILRSVVQRYIVKSTNLANIISKPNNLEEEVYSKYEC
jgi:hypothetical protein